jgi:hypothetical protein
MDSHIAEEDGAGDIWHVFEALCFEFGCVLIVLCLDLGGAVRGRASEPCGPLRGTSIPQSGTEGRIRSLRTGPN